VWPEGVVFVAVIVDHHAGFGKCPALLLVETFVPEASMGTLYIAVLIRLSPHPSDPPSKALCRCCSIAMDCVA